MLEGAGSLVSTPFLLPSIVLPDDPQMLCRQIHSKSLACRTTNKPSAYAQMAAEPSAELLKSHPSMHNMRVTWQMLEQQPAEAPGNASKDLTQMDQITNVQLYRLQPEELERFTTRIHGMR